MIREEKEIRRNHCPLVNLGGEYEAGRCTSLFCTAEMFIIESRNEWWWQCHSLWVADSQKRLDALSLTNYRLPVVRKEGVYVWNSALPTALNSLSMDAHCSLSLSLFGFLFLNLPLWLELTFSLYLLSKCFETTEGGGFAKITPIKDCSCGWWRSQQHAKRTGCYLQCHEMFKMLLD